MTREGNDVMQKRLWTVEDLAGYLGFTVRTIYNMNYLGTGPRVTKVGRQVRYREEDVESWLTNQNAA
jgi:excisionase family DNA binding protein